MKVVHGVDGLHRGLGRLFVVIGVFDGIHLGHLYLLDRLAVAAEAARAAPAVITFDHHPDEVITGSAPPLLCDPEERLERLAAARVAVTVVQTFDVALRMTPFDAFVRRIAGHVELAGFLMTPESAFGHDRGGTPETVTALGRELDYQVVVVPQFELDGRPVRSTDIRAAVASGDLPAAARLLGRPYAVTGDASEVEPGRVALRFAMPVALPPAGTYRAMADLAPLGPAREAEARIDPRGELTLETPPFVGRVRVAFATESSGSA